MDGLKIGLEIHAQLEGKKLFCECPTLIRDDEHNVSVTRHLRAAAGETGEVDIAAKTEQLKAKHFIYEGFSNTTCLVELDEEPPHNMNPEALAVTLQVAKLLKASPVDEVQVMRKTVVDGSNTSGFQRTALVASGGKIDGVGIQTVCVEEDAARIIKKEKDHTVFRLDRLGIPLIEIATDPDITSPEQAKEIAEKIGLLVRSTGKAKRGLGTIRQDLNVSIPGGARIEIKGAQDLKMLPTLAEQEAERQKNLLDLSKGFKGKAESKIYDVTNLFDKCESKVIQSALKSNGKVLAIKLKDFSGVLGTSVQHGRRVATELSDYAKVLAGVKGLFHTDELPSYGITESEVAEVSKELALAQKDAFILIADEQDRATRALDAVVQRANQLKDGVSSEVRKANPDGSSSFLRPMPGAARMYPETDVQPIKVTTELLSSLADVETIDKVAKRFEKLGLGRDLAPKIARSEKKSFFEQLVKENKNLKPAFIAETLLSYGKELQKSPDANVGLIHEGHLKELFKALDNGGISKQSINDILLQVASGKKLELSKFGLMSDTDLEKELQQIVSENQGMQFNALIGKAMAKLRGKAEGKKIAELLKKLI